MAEPLTIPQIRESNIHFNNALYGNFKETIVIDKKAAEEYIFPLQEKYSFGLSGAPSDPNGRHHRWPIGLTILLGKRGSGKSERITSILKDVRAHKVEARYLSIGERNSKYPIYSADIVSDFLNEAKPGDFVAIDSVKGMWSEERLLVNKPAITQGITSPMQDIFMTLDALCKARGLVALFNMNPLVVSVDLVAEIASAQASGLIHLDDRFATGSFGIQSAESTISSAWNDEKDEIKSDRYMYNKVITHAYVGVNSASQQVQFTEIGSDFALTDKAVSSSSDEFLNQEDGDEL